VCKRALGGGLLVGGFNGLVDDADAVLVAGAEGDLWEQVRCVEAAEALFGDEQQSPDQGGGVGDLLVALPASVRRRTAAKGDSTGLVVRRCFQCSRGKS